MPAIQSALSSPLYPALSSDRCGASPLCAGGQPAGSQRTSSGQRLGSPRTAVGPLSRIAPPAGDLPTSAQAAALTEDLRARSALPAHVVKALPALISLRAIDCSTTELIFLLCSIASN